MGEDIHSGTRLLQPKIMEASLCSSTRLSIYWIIFTTIYIFRHLLPIHWTFPTSRLTGIEDVLHAHTFISLLRTCENPNGSSYWGPGAVVRASIIYDMLVSLNWHAISYIYCPRKWHPSNWLEIYRVNSKMIHLTWKTSDDISQVFSV